MREAWQADTPESCYFSHVSVGKPEASWLGLLVTLAYISAVLVPCAPPTVSSISEAVSHHHAGHSNPGSESEVGLSSHADVHPDATSAAKSPRTTLVAFCECGCDSPGAPQSKARAKSNGLKAHEPTWIPPSARADFLESAVVLVDEPTFAIETVPISC